MCINFNVTGKQENNNTLEEQLDPFNQREIVKNKTKSSDGALLVAGKKKYFVFTMKSLAGFTFHFS